MKEGSGLYSAAQRGNSQDRWIRLHELKGNHCVCRFYTVQGVDLSHPGGKWR